MIKKYYKEIIYQLLLIVTVFFAITLHKEHPHVHMRDVYYFLNSLFAVFVINYVLLPKFFYKKRFIGFSIYTAMLIGVAMLIEESVLEQIFFPYTKGRSFPGILSTMIDVLPVIVLLVGLKFAWDAQMKQSQVNNLNQKIAEDQLAFLNSQINPHFLFNNLNNIYSYALHNSPKTPELILRLSSVLRYMLYDCKENSVPLNLELKKLEDFLNIQELQFETRAIINYSIDGNPEQKNIAPLILIVFVENAFKHSASGLTENIKIDINISIEDDNLLFTCTNNYLKAEENLTLTKGIGIENVTKRLNLLYDNAHTLDIIDKKNSYTVKLLLKLQNAQND